MDTLDSLTLHAHGGQFDLISGDRCPLLHPSTATSTTIIQEVVVFHLDRLSMHVVASYLKHKLMVLYYSVFFQVCTNFWMSTYVHSLALFSHNLSQSPCNAFQQILAYSDKNKHNIMHMDSACTQCVCCAI